MAAKTPKTNIFTQILGIPGGIVKFIKQAREELKKVKWPSRETTIQYTAVVIASSLIIGAIAGGVDYLLIRFVESIIL